MENLKSEIVITKDLANWCIKNLHILRDKDVSDAMESQNSQKSAMEKVEGKLARLLDLRLSRDEMSDDEEALFDSKEKQLRVEFEALKEQSQVEENNWLQELETSLNLMSEILEVLESGSLTEKRDMLHEIRTNLTFSQKKVLIKHIKSVELLANCFNGIDPKIRAYEPIKYGSTKEKNDHFKAAFPALLRRLDRVRTWGAI
jgi:hypothetical protein